MYSNNFKSFFLSDNNKLKLLHLLDDFSSFFLDDLVYGLVYRDQ